MDPAGGAAGASPEPARSRALVYEIENEPEFDKWDAFKDEYVKFTIRTAKLIKRADPSAKVMINNVYGIPSGLNHQLLANGGAKVIDIVSWHDYHEGWLADARVLIVSAPESPR